MSYAASKAAQFRRPSVRGDAGGRLPESLHDVEQGGVHVVLQQVLPGLGGYPVGVLLAYGLRLISDTGSVTTCVCPGLVDTQVLRNWTAAHATTPQETAREYQLIKRPQTGREIGRAVAFLASMPSMTGQAINVDGGTILS